MQRWSTKIKKGAGYQLIVNSQLFSHVHLGKNIEVLLTPNAPTCTCNRRTLPEVQLGKPAQLINEFKHMVVVRTICAYNSLSLGLFQSEQSLYDLNINTLSRLAPFLISLQALSSILSDVVHVLNDCFYVIVIFKCAIYA